MVSAPQPDQELNRIRGAINAARENLKRSTAMEQEPNFDVAPLTGALERLCEQIAALPTDSARGFAAPLQSTLQLLEALEDDIRQAHGELQQRMRAMGASESEIEAEFEAEFEAVAAADESTD
jgi:hypothetical protein